MSLLVSQPDHGSKIAEDNGDIKIPYQNFFDEIVLQINTNLLGQVVILPEYTVAALPAASSFKGGHINVTDETGGYTGAYSDGSDWRRYQDRAVVS